jgi:integrase
MVFQVKSRGPFKLRVVGPDGASVTHSTGLYKVNDARAVEELVERWRGKRGLAHERRDILALLTSKPPRLALREAYRWHLEGTLDAQVAALTAAAQDLDLHPLVDEWYREKRVSQKGSASADNYLRQVRRLFPASEPFPRSLFTRREVWARLDALPLSAPSKNRNRAAVSSFAKFLLKREVIDTNFVRDIEGYGEHEPRMVYYDVGDAQRLIRGLAQPYAAIAAAALGFCAEWGALERARVGDFGLSDDPVTMHVRGSKRAWRDRVVPLLPELSWVLDFLRPQLKGKMPASPFIEGVPEWRALRVQQETAASLAIVAVGEAQYGPHTIHDWRHTHSVWLVKWGYSEQIGAAHLGHRDTDQFRKRYSVFKPDRLDYARAATKSATTPRREVK